MQQRLAALLGLQTPRAPQMNGCCTICRVTGRVCRRETGGGTAMLIYQRTGGSYQTMRPHKAEGTNDIY